MTGKALKVVIGVDFDNTIACYDEIVYTAALELGLIDPAVPRIKKEVRDAIRELPGGELQWQRLQGIVYGPRMKEAQLTEGAASFFQEWIGKGVNVYVVSHKTEFANFDETHTNLRQSAMAWMEDKGFFGSTGLGLSPKNVFWEEPRQKKVERIAQLGCTHFIDDLEEVFDEPGFPREVQGILYAPNFDQSHLPRVKVARSWSEVTDHVSYSVKAEVPGRLISR